MEDDKILRRFLDDAGRVTGWPSKHSNKLTLLKYLAGKFEPGKRYTEKEVNAVLNEWHTFGDWAVLRRALVDAGFLSRDLAGTRYELTRRLL